MPLRAVVDTLDDVPESLREHYTEQQDGTYLLSVDGGNSNYRLEDVKSLQKTLQTERNGRKEAERSLKEWAKLGESPDEVAEKLKSTDRDGKSGASNDVEQDRLKRELEKAEKRYQQQLADRDKAVESYRGRLSQTLLEREIMDGIASHRLAPKAEKAVRAMVRDRLKVLEEDGQHRVAVLDEDGQEAYSNRQGAAGKPMSTAELVDSLRSDHPYLFEASGKTGTGSGPAAGGGGRPTKIDLNAPGADLLSNAHKLR